jgi:hypothetical protein
MIRKSGDSKSTSKDARKPRRGNAPLLNWRRFSHIFEKSRIESLALWLIILSLFDLLLTYVLLYSFSEVYEANPVALWFFHRWNIFGMTIFKFVLVGFVIAVSEIIERYRPGLGKLVMVFACVTVGAVVYKGLQIFMGQAGFSN